MKLKNLCLAVLAACTLISAQPVYGSQRFMNLARYATAAVARCSQAFQTIKNSQQVQWIAKHPLATTSFLLTGVNELLETPYSIRNLFKKRKLQLEKEHSYREQKEIEDLLEKIRTSKTQEDMKETTLLLHRKNWKSPGANKNSTRTTFSCIYDEKHHTCDIASMGNDFVVNYIEHADTDCVNPSFPAIHITTKSKHTAWLHVVRTDTAVSTWQEFIDTVDQTQDPFLYPFYTREQDFYDAPCWTYTIFQKPLSFWRAHAYAVQIDCEAKTIECVGGISWGFELLEWLILPKCTVPSALTKQDWEKDWDVFKTALPEYKNL